MKHILTAFCAGFLLAIGLGISEMTRPLKIQAFLDLFGEWDPSLLFVMGGAVGVYALAYRFSPNKIVAKKQIDRPLVLGAAIFGIGWGLSGFCPGPAVVSLTSLDVKAWLFVILMLVGMRVP